MAWGLQTGGEPLLGQPDLLLLRADMASHAAFQHLERLAEDRPGGPLPFRAPESEKGAGKEPARQSGRQNCRGEGQGQLSPDRQGQGQPSRRQPPEQQGPGDGPEGQAQLRPGQASAEGMGPVIRRQPDLKHPHGTVPPGGPGSLLDRRLELPRQGRGQRQPARRAREPGNAVAGQGEEPPAGPARPRQEKRMGQIRIPVEDGERPQQRGVRPRPVAQHPSRQPDPPRAEATAEKAVGQAQIGLQGQELPEQVGADLAPVLAKGLPPRRSSPALAEPRQFRGGSPGPPVQHPQPPGHQGPHRGLTERGRALVEPGIARGSPRQGICPDHPDGEGRGGDLPPQDGAKAVQHRPGLDRVRMPGGRPAWSSLTPGPPPEAADHPLHGRRQPAFRRQFRLGDAQGRQQGLLLVGGHLPFLLLQQLAGEEIEDERRQQEHHQHDDQGPEPGRPGDADRGPGRTGGRAGVGTGHRPQLYLFAGRPAKRNPFPEAGAGPRSEACRPEGISAGPLPVAASREPPWASVGEAIGEIPADSGGGVRARAQDDGQRPPGLYQLTL